MKHKSDKASYIRLREEKGVKAEVKKETSILQLFPDTYRPLFKETVQKETQVQEIRLRAEKPVLVLFGGKEFFLTEDGGFTREKAKAKKMGQRELDEILNHICRYSVYAYEDEIRQGFLTVQGGHRIGVAGQAVLKTEKEIKTLKYIRFLNIRISHEIFGAADGILPFLYHDGYVCSTLLLSMPGIGKTTLLRDMIRQVSEGNTFGEGVSVGVVDERSELAGCFQGMAQNNLGIRTDVLDACPKALGMTMLLRSMSPKVIAVDEIGGIEDEQAIKRLTRCGVRVFATAHGNGIEDLQNTPWGQQLIKEQVFERYIVLERETDGRIKRTGYDKEFKKCFVC